MLHWFGCKISLSLKRQRILQKIPQANIFFSIEMLTQVFFSKKSKILKVSDQVALENSILISKTLHKTLLKILCDWFNLAFEYRTYSTRWANKCCINVPSHCIKSYGRYFVIINTINFWNFLQSQHQVILFYLLGTKQLEDFISNYFLARYI